MRMRKINKHSPALEMHAALCARLPGDAWFIARCSGLDTHRASRPAPPPPPPPAGAPSGTCCLPSRCSAPGAPASGRGRRGSSSPRWAPPRPPATSQSPSPSRRGQSWSCRASSPPTPPLPESQCSATRAAPSPASGAPPCPLRRQPARARPAPCLSRLAGRPLPLGPGL